MPPPVYQFRAVTPPDLPLLREWLLREQVREWWGDPARGLANIAGNIGYPAINPFIVVCDGVPIGYIQSWNPHWEADHPCRDQPLGTRGIDQFIGELQFVGRGHGTALIRLFAESLFEVGTTGHHGPQSA